MSEEEAIVGELIFPYKCILVMILGKVVTPIYIVFSYTILMFQFIFYKSCYFCM
jgi:hypothetical protein